jgi:hypothetical protein
MLGGTLVGACVRDVRSVVRWLRTRDDVDASTVSIWGDSFVEPHGTHVPLAVPRDDDAAVPAGPEPLGSLVALLAALLENGVDAVWIHRGIGNFASVLDRPMVLVPSDVVVPGIVAAGDLPELVAQLAPCAIAMRDTVDGCNRPVAPETLRELYGRAIAAHEASQSLTFEGSDSPAAWFDQVGKRREAR